MRFVDHIQMHPGNVEIHSVRVLDPAPHIREAQLTMTRVRGGHWVGAMTYHAADGHLVRHVELTDRMGDVFARRMLASA